MGQEAAQMLAVPTASIWLVKEKLHNRCASDPSARIGLSGHYAGPCVGDLDVEEEALARKPQKVVLVLAPRMPSVRRLLGNVRVVDLAVVVVAGGVAADFQGQLRWRTPFTQISQHPYDLAPLCAGAGPRPDGIGRLHEDEARMKGREVLASDGDETLPVIRHQRAVTCRNADERQVRIPAPVARADENMPTSLKPDPSVEIRLSGLSTLRRRFRVGRRVRHVLGRGIQPERELLF